MHLSINFIVQQLVFLLFCHNAFATPLRRLRKRHVLPYWHMACGELIDTLDTNTVINEEDIRASFDRIKLQHQLTLTDYLNRDYEYLYERVRIGVHQRQYIPNWLPGKKDVHVVKKLTGKSIDMIISHLPKFHTDLQKFAVAIEELLNDEPTFKIQEALKLTQSYIKMMLCVLETDITMLPNVSVFERIDRNIMTDNERNPVDETRRLVRDWGVLLKYKDYLHAWRHVFNY